MTEHSAARQEASPFPPGANGPFQEKAGASVILKTGRARSFATTFPNNIALFTRHNRFLLPPRGTGKVGPGLRCWRAGMDLSRHRTRTTW